MMDSTFFSSRKWLLILAISVGFINILPAIIFNQFDGDVILAYALLQCFGEQVWQGHFFPRWCMNANGGYGSPAPIFYFPLPFYATSLIYPLRYLGMEIKDIYFVGLWQVSVVAFITATLWLRSYTSYTKALCCAAIFLWLGYRMEALTFRASYAESWAIALMPILFLKVHTLIKDDRSNWPQLALIITLLLLTHAPATLIGLIACGIQLVLLKPRALPSLICATLLGYAATLCHWEAAHMLEDTLNTAIGGVKSWRASWLNAFADYFFVDMAGYINPIFIEKYTRLGWITGISIPAMLVCAFWFCSKGRISNRSERNEACVWLLIMLIGLFMMFSPSTPFWKLIVLVSRVETPWRMAMLVMFGFVALLAIASHNIWNHWSNAKKTIMVALLLCLMTSGTPLWQVKLPRSDREIRSLPMVIYTQTIFSYFNLQWLDLHYLLPDTMRFYEEFVLNRPQTPAHFIDTKGEAKITAWGYDGIFIQTSRNTPGTMLVEHLYHPIWHATIDGKPAPMKPEEDKIGRMLVEVPAGEHAVSITMDVAKALPERYRWIELASLISMLVIMGGYLKHIFYTYSSRTQRNMPS